MYALRHSSIVRQILAGVPIRVVAVNHDTSIAMLGDKCRAVVATGAEVCTAVDGSCLMQIGGGLARGRAGVRTMHLAEILAATEEA